MIHFHTDYFRPSWQGGDTAQPLCRKPANGLFCGLDLTWHMSRKRQAVTCPSCLYALEAGLRTAPDLNSRTVRAGIAQIAQRVAA